MVAQTPAPDPPRRLSPAQAAEHLQSLGYDTGPRPIYDAIHDGSLPATRLGKWKLFVTVEDLELRFIAPATAPDDIDRHIAALVDAAPPLTDEQRMRLASIMSGGHDAATP